MFAVKQMQKIFIQNKLFIGLLALLFLRFIFLENKPIHHDESVNAWWLTQITEKGFFAYDPTNYHGPLFFYIQWMLERFFGSDLWVLRIGSVLFSCLSVSLLWQRNYRFGALLMALSPAFFFFSRSGIHESMFVFFQMLLLFGWIDLYEKKDGALSLILVGIVGSLALKETWALSWIALMLATGFLGYRFLLAPFANQKIRKNTSLVIWMGVLVWALLFTGFMQKPTGILDFFKAFMPWLQTGTHGSGHDKPFWFWLEILFKYESLLALVLLASSYFVVKWRKTEKIFVFIYAFFVFQFLIYSLIPYKTIWCLISLIWPLCLLVDTLSQKIKFQKNAPIGILLGLIVFGAWQAVWVYRLNLQKPIHFDHPYVYVQSTQELKQFADNVNTDKRVLVMLSDPWPFPWIFRNNPHVRYVNTLLPEEEFNQLLIESELIVTDPEHLPSFEMIQNASDLHPFFLRKGDREIFVMEKK